MIPLLFFIISGVCAPFDYTDCDYNLDFSEKPLGYTRGYYQFGDTVFFNTFHPNFYGKDCWGLTTWQHEWLHVEIGHWHLDGNPPISCMYRDGSFVGKFKDSWMVTHSGLYQS